MSQRLEARALRFETSWSPADVEQMLREHVEAPGAAGLRLGGEVGPGGFQLRLRRAPGALPGPVVEGVLRRTPAGGSRVEVVVHEGGALASALAIIAVVLLTTGAFALVGLALFLLGPSLLSAAFLAASLIPVGTFGAPLYRHGRGALDDFLSDVRLVDRFFHERLPVASGGRAGPFRSPRRG